MSGLYPAMLRLDGRRCVMVGGGRVAARKVGSLLEAAADVVVIAPACDPLIEVRAAEHRLAVIRRPYRRGDLTGAWLAFAATDSRAVNAEVAAEAERLGIPANVADNPARSSFQVPATVHRGDVTVAASTGGRSPAFARRLRHEIERLLTPGRLALLELYAELRDRAPGRWTPDGRGGLGSGGRRGAPALARGAARRGRAPGALERPGRERRRPERMPILAVGLTHREAPLELRERLAIPRERLALAVEKLDDFVSEGVILSTCNRTEIYANVGHLGPAGGRWCTSWAR